MGESLLTTRELARNPLVIPTPGGGGSGGGAMTEAAVQANAGVLSGVTRSTNTGNLTVYANLSNTTVTGNLTIGSSALTLTNVQILGATYPAGVNGTQFINCDFASGVWPDGANAGLTFQRCTFRNANTAAHMQIWDNGGRTSNLTIEECWFHGVNPVGAATGSHMENLHIAGVNGALIQRTSFNMQAPDAPTQACITACVTLEPWANDAENTNIVFDSNWLHYGGYYQLYFLAVGVCSVTNNAFHSAGELGNTPQYPPSAYIAAQLPVGGVYPKFTQAGNTLDGAALSLPGGF